MGKTPSKFSEVCPRQLSELPCSACPSALERINAIKAAKLEKKTADVEPTSGCPWFIASSEDNYCFWSYLKKLDGDPATDKEICDLLLINKTTLEKTCDSAINKLQDIKDTEIIKEFAESVAEIAERTNSDYSAYMPSEFREAILKSAAEEPSKEEIPDIIDEKKKKKKHPTGLPLHRDGKKVDLFGLYSRKQPAPKRGAKENGEKPKNNKK
jgi:hypothetical protein